MVTGDIGGAVYVVAAVVPVFCIAGEGPGLVLSDEILNAKGLDVAFESIRQCPPGFELLRCEADVNGVVGGDAAGPFKEAFDDNQPTVPAGHQGVCDNAAGDRLVVRYRSG